MSDTYLVFFNYYNDVTGELSHRHILSINRERTVQTLLYHVTDEHRTEYTSIFITLGYQYMNLLTLPQQILDTPITYYGTSIEIDFMNPTNGSMIQTNETS